MMVKERLPRSKEEMLDYIKREAEKRGYSFSIEESYRYLFSISEGDKEVKGVVKETGKIRVKHPYKVWVGIKGADWIVLQELDPLRCFIVEMDYLKDNFLIIPISLIPEEC